MKSEVLNINSNKISDKTKNNLIIALVLNIILVVFESVAFVYSIADRGYHIFLYYTQDSNIFLLVTSIIFIVYASIALKTGKEVPVWVHKLRYYSTCCVMLTFLVVLLILGPISNAFLSYMFYGSMLFHHTLCPIVAFVSFIFFENNKIISKKEMWLALIPTVVYAVVLIILNIVRVVEGPYPFLLVYEFPVHMICLFLTGLLLMTCSICWFIKWLYNKRNKKRVEG